MNDAKMSGGTVQEHLSENCSGRKIIYQFFLMKENQIMQTHLTLRFGLVNI